MNKELTIAELDKKIRFDKRGLILSDHLNYEQWESLGMTLRTMEGSVLWWIGDWINYGERKYGEMYSQALDSTDYERGTLRKAKYLSSKIEMFRRRNLSWSHHMEVAKLEPEQQDHLLVKAETEKLTCKQLREEVRREALPEPEELKPIPEKFMDFRLTIHVYKDPKENIWLAKCEEFDLVGTASTMPGAIRGIGSLCASYLEYAEKNDNWDFI